MIKSEHCPQCHSTRTKPKGGWPCVKCVRVAKMKQTPFVQDFVRSMFNLKQTRTDGQRT